MEKMTKLSDIANIKDSIEQCPEYAYQIELTKKLDSVTGDFSQDIINEIVLWKVNRYAKLSQKALDLINQITPTATELDESLTREILKELLETKGIKLAMASTILRFKNPHIYQIIDQRVYRIIYGETLKNSTNIQQNIVCYLDYLKQLKHLCEQYDIEFSSADRELYRLDKLVNEHIPIRY